MNHEEVCAWCDAAIYGGAACLSAVAGFGWLLSTGRKISRRSVAGQVITSAATGLLVSVCARELAGQGISTSLAVAAGFGMLGKVATDLVGEIATAWVRAKYGAPKE